MLRSAFAQRRACRAQRGAVRGVTWYYRATGQPCRARSGPPTLALTFSRSAMLPLLPSWLLVLPASTLRRFVSLIASQKGIRCPSE